MAAEFSAAALARKIFKDRTLTLREKQHAWLSLMEVMPDETVQTTDSVQDTPEERSLHELLRAFVAEQRLMEAQFFADEPDTVYLTSYQNTETEDWFRAYYPYLSWDDVLENILYDHDGQACVTKYYPKQYVNGFMRELTAEFNELGLLMNITCRMMITRPVYRDLFWAMLDLQKQDHYRKPLCPP